MSLNISLNNFLLSQLRHPIVIQAPKEEVNEEGEVVTNWYNVVEIFASITPITPHLSAEYAVLDQIMSINYYLFTVRYLKDIKYSSRIIYKDRFFNIKRITNNQEENKILKIIVQEE